MNDDRLIEMLGSLRYERMSRAADARIKRRLEEEHVDLTEHRGIGSLVRALAPAFATAVLIAGVAMATMGAPGDSPLYAVRVAVEDAAIALYPEPHERLQYVQSLYEQRQAEAARLESVGSAASGGARRIERRTLETLEGLLPPAPDQVPLPAPSPDPSPTSSPSPSPTPSPTPTPARTVTPTQASAPSPTPTRTASPRPTPSTTPKPPTPVPTPAPTAIPVVLRGIVTDPAGTGFPDACVSFSVGDCRTRTDLNGAYQFTTTAKVGQTFTVYAWRTDATGRITHKGSATVTVRGTSVEVPPIRLELR